MSGTLIFSDPFSASRKKEATCILMFKSNLSENAKKRINILKETNDGFVISEKDGSGQGKVCRERTIKNNQRRQIKTTERGE